jgi:hypothetical protein
VTQLIAFGLGRQIKGMSSQVWSMITFHSKTCCHRSRFWVGEMIKYLLLIILFLNCNQRTGDLAIVYLVSAGYGSISIRYKLATVHVLHGESSICIYT